MRHFTCMLLAMGFYVLFLMPVESSAQQVTSFEQLQLLVKSGDKIFVTDPAGKTSKVRISQLSSSSLSVIVNGVKRDLPQSDVLEIKQWRHDSLANGAGIGALVGLGTGIITGVVICRWDECNGAATAAALGGIYAGIGAGVGAGIDARSDDVHIGARDDDSPACRRQSGGASFRSKKPTISAFITSCIASRSKPSGSCAASPATIFSAQGKLVTKEK